MGTRTSAAWAPIVLRRPLGPGRWSRRPEPGRPAAGSNRPSPHLCGSLPIPAPNQHAEESPNLILGSSAMAMRRNSTTGGWAAWALTPKFSVLQLGPVGLSLKQGQHPTPRLPASDPRNYRHPTPAITGIRDPRLPASDPRQRPAAALGGPLWATAANRHPSPPRSACGTWRAGRCGRPRRTGIRARRYRHAAPGGPAVAGERGEPASGPAATGMRHAWPRPGRARRLDRAPSI
jgi:hypothetical protein